MSLSIEKVLGAIDEARVQLSQKRGYPIYPEAPVCGFICEGVIQMHGDRLPVENFPIELPGTLHHVIRTTDGKTVFDPQYKQFVPAHLHQDLPDVLILNLAKGEDLSSRLQKMAIPKNIADPYAEALTEL